MKTPLPLLAMLAATSFSFGCTTRRSGDDAIRVTLDLNKTAPIGYEICASHPPQLARENVDLSVQLPPLIDISSERGTFGVKAIRFVPGQHDVDVYRDLHSPRVLWTKGNLSMRNSTPVLNVKLRLAELGKGRYILGFAGEPYFAYCTVDLQ